jgi:hypothetical protein
MSWDVFRAEIDRRLNKLRPPRYREDDDAWMEPVKAWAAENMPAGPYLEDLDEEDE